jgi:hypothetical protein
LHRKLALLIVPASVDLESAWGENNCATGAPLFCLDAAFLNKPDALAHVAARMPKQITNVRNFLQYARFIDGRSNFL